MRAAGIVEATRAGVLTRVIVRGQRRVRHSLAGALVARRQVATHVLAWTVTVVQQALVDVCKNKKKIVALIQVENIMSRAFAHIPIPGDIQALPPPPREGRAVMDSRRESKCRRSTLLSFDGGGWKNSRRMVVFFFASLKLLSFFFKHSHETSIL